jgi:glycosyltransferase involved in cell wall biosynthesis
MPSGDQSRLRHLGVNAMFLEPQMGGVETYVRQLFPAILEARPDLRLSFFVNKEGAALLAADEWKGDIELVTYPVLGRRGTRALSETMALGFLADRKGCDLIHSVALTAPIHARAASIVTIADTTWLRHAGAVPRATRLLWKTLVRPAARRAGRIISHSQASRAEIAEDLAISPDRIDVIAHGPGAPTRVEPTPERELRSRLGLGQGPIVLAVSALLAHKNLASLVEAMVAVREQVADAVLVVPGNWTSLRPELEALAERLGIQSAVVFPGWLTAPDLEGLYSAAACFAFPSLREGFGLPVLEAMQRGLPVACSNASAVPEVAGDAALLFDPRRPHEIAGALVRILTDSRLAGELAGRSRRRAAQFTWQRAAVETLASYERAVVTG